MVQTNVHFLEMDCQINLLTIWDNMEMNSVILPTGRGQNQLNELDFMGNASWISEGMFIGLEKQLGINGIDIDLKEDIN